MPVVLIWGMLLVAVEDVLWHFLSVGPDGDHNRLLEGRRMLLMGGERGESATVLHKNRDF